MRLDPPTPFAALHALTAAHAQGWLEVGDGHRIWFEEAGNPQGLPVVCLHGGPASGSTPAQRRFFDPARYRIVQFDQRGCGRSLPLGSAQANTTAHLVQDTHALRQHLGISRWLVAGGSWGGSLALAYAGAHPADCLGLLLRGVFLAQQGDLDWFFGGARALRPAEFARLCTLPGLHEQASPTEVLEGLAQALSKDTDLARQALRHWQQWEAALEGSPCGTPAEDRLPALLAKYRLQSHYLRHQCFLEARPLLAQAAALVDTPGAILHGQFDLVCRPQGAWQLHQAWPGSVLHWVANAGHNPFQTPMASAMRACADHFAEHGHFPTTLPMNPHQEAAP